MIIIVGATRGLGRTLARHLAAVRKEPLLLAARQLAPLLDLAAELGTRGAPVQALQLDLSSVEQVERCIKQVSEQTSPVRAVCITAAGFYRGAFGEQDPARMEELVRTTFTGPARLVAGLIRNAPRASPMDVVLVTSLGAATNLDASRSSAMHIATKAALHTLAVVSGRELASAGVRVCAVAPGTLKRNGRPGVPEEAVASCIEAVLSMPVEATIESIVIRPTGVTDANV